MSDLFQLTKLRITTENSGMSGELVIALGHSQENAREIREIRGKFHVSTHVSSRGERLSARARNGSNGSKQEMRDSQ